MAVFNINNIFAYNKFIFQLRILSKTVLILYDVFIQDKISYNSSALV